MDLEGICWGEWPEDYGGLDLGRRTQKHEAVPLVERLCVPL